ncbi:MAG: methyltransferase [Candidatus Marinimicrobia bacterium]|nr:methyltransferase [Candidatus Neomarinimicrobiota bacterium]|tara:strand:- start:621 stop:1505 length:885 start_codon:yes stop_codon:yes gene_type:complete
MKSITHCSLCGDRNLTIVLKAKDWLVTKEIFDIFECSRCKSRHTSPIPDEQEISRYYNSEEYRPHNLKSQKISDFIYRTIRGIMIEKKRKWIRDFSGLKRGRLLDVGSGTGEFAASMRNNGWEVCCVESSKHIRSIAKENYSLDVISPDVWSEKKKGFFDVITFWHTLEHVHDPKLYIEMARSQLSKKGTIFIGVPNFLSYDGNFYAENWAAYDVPRHLTHFSPSFMDKFFDVLNLKLLEVIGLPFDSYYVSMLSAKNLGGNFISGLWTGFISNKKAKAETKLFSSLIYVVKPK